MLPSLFLIVDAAFREIAPVLPYALPIAILAAVRIGWKLKAATDSRRRADERWSDLRA